MAHTLNFDRGVKKGDSAGGALWIFCTSAPSAGKMGKRGGGGEQAKQWHCTAAEDEAALRKKALTKLT